MGKFRASHTFLKVGFLRCSVVTISNIWRERNMRTDGVGGKHAGARSETDRLTESAGGGAASTASLVGRRGGPAVHSDRSGGKRD